MCDQFPDFHGGFVSLLCETSVLQLLGGFGQLSRRVSIVPVQELGFRLDQPCLGLNQPVADPEIAFYAQGGVQDFPCLILKRLHDSAERLIEFSDGMLPGIVSEAEHDREQHQQPQKPQHAVPSASAFMSPHRFCLASTCIKLPAATILTAGSESFSASFSSAITRAPV